MTERLVLASGSPRRAELLGGLGLLFEIRPADIDESVNGEESSVAGMHELVIAADTTVDLGGELLGKPETDHEARVMLHRLSRATHRVHTAVCVHRVDQDGSIRVVVDVSTTAVTFADLPERWVDWYVGTGEPLDKAGGYGMQGSAALFVSSIDGSPTNVIGLPLTMLARLVNEVGTDLFAFAH
jgi:septum formation protein